MVNGMSLMEAFKEVEARSLMVGKYVLCALCVGGGVCVWGGVFCVCVCESAFLDGRLHTDECLHRDASTCANS